MEIRRIQSSDVTGFLELWSRVFSEGEFLAKGPPPEDRVSRIVAKVVVEEIPINRLFDFMKSVSLYRQKRVAQLHYLQE